MVPAADEFKQKHHGRIRSLSGPAFKSIRVRRSRRVTYCAVAVLIIVLYNLIGISTRWSQPLESPLDTDLEEYPWANYSPILEADPEDQRGQQDFAIRFPDLYATLGRASFAGLRNYNRIVLYAAESLESASKLAGIACEMSTYDRVHVHLALLGQEEFPIDLFQKMNGLSVESGCKVSIHDARPENATEFTQEQMQLSVKAAMKHLYRYLHPQAVLVDMEHEAHWFLKILKQRTKILGITTIELPEHAAENMRWITKLDSGSLKGWHIPKVEVYIRSDKNHSGNLERLLRSLRDAEYFDVIPLRITIEFDPSYPIHPFTREFLINYNWPSRGRLTIQNPILPESDPLRKAIRFVESFYPVDQGTAVLFLDPNVELSPYYIHWLHYATLEYRYSSSLYSDAAAIYGISLVTPRAYLNGTIPFNPNIPSSTPFLYSAPSAEAALFFPQHWSQFHAYFRRRIKGALNFENGTLPDMTIPNMNLSPDISNSWLLYFTELVKARGFLMLYPSWGLDIPETPNAEYPASKKQVMALTHQEVPSYTRSKPSLGIDLAQEEELLTTNGFLQMLPGEDLPPLIALPVRNLHGEEVRAADLEAEADEYKTQITKDCTIIDPPGDWFDVSDLFCDGTSEDGLPDE